jgi:hypothetical protein
MNYQYYMRKMLADMQNTSTAGLGSLYGGLGGAYGGQIGQYARNLTQPATMWDPIAGEALLSPMSVVVERPADSTETQWLDRRVNEMRVRL